MVGQLIQQLRAITLHCNEFMIPGACDGGQVEYRSGIGDITK